MNLTQLQFDSVNNISCGDPGVSRAVPVNVNIIEPSIPTSPVITMVTAAYQSEQLDSVKVTWMKSVSSL